MRARRLLILWCVAASSLANAGNRIVVLTDPAQRELPRALEVALANRHVDISSLPSPEGALRLDRAAVVQRAAIANTADAGVWIDVDAGETDVCVVSSDGKLRHAPLPADVPPRVFAAIAASLLDELLAPPESPPISVDVYVDVHTNPAPPVMSPPPSRSHVVVMVPPGESSTVIAHAPFEPDAPWHRSRLEVGVTASLVTYGVEAELLYPVADSVRIGVLGGFNWLYDYIMRTRPAFAGCRCRLARNETMADAGLELRYVGRGLDARRRRLRERWPRDWRRQLLPDHQRNPAALPLGAAQSHARVRRIRRVGVSCRR